MGSLFIGNAGGLGTWYNFGIISASRIGGTHVLIYLRVMALWGMASTTKKNIRRSFVSASCVYRDEISQIESIFS